MNKGLYKLVYSKRHRALVVVGETVSSSSRCTGNTGFLGSVATLLGTFVLSATCALLYSGEVFAGPVINALPVGASVAQGKAVVNQSGNTMTITQASDKAVINFQSFDIAAGAKVNIVQPSANSVQLDRVIGNNPSQLMGQLVSNGQVMLVNPNGVVVGKDGSVSASGFTASSYGITDADFLGGKYKFDRNGTTAGVRNDGRIETTSGGYVALIGVDVINSGQIIAPQGNVILAAGESVTIPAEFIQAAGVQNNAIDATSSESISESTSSTSPASIGIPLSSRVRLNVSAAAIHTAVTNTKDGVILTEGGQVLLQAAAVSDAVASITQSGRIDVSGPASGSVTVLADQGKIKIDGLIAANSAKQNTPGGKIIIGRDPDTGELAKSTDASGAILQARSGLIETSGRLLKTDGVSIAARTWLLDPNDIVIGNTATTGGSITAAQTANGTSYILASDVTAAMTTGTNVIIATSASSTGGNGDITVNAAISNSAASNGLTLNAHRNIIVNSGITASNISLNSSGGSISGPGSLWASDTITLNQMTAGTLSGGIGGAASLTKAGLGTLTLAANNGYTGATNINAGKLTFTTPSSSYGSTTNISSLYASTAFNIASGATLDFNTPVNANVSSKATTFAGAGTLSKSGGGGIKWDVGATTFALSPGALIDLQGGVFTASFGYYSNWTNNKSSLNIAAGANFATAEGNVRVDALTGSGWLTLGYIGVGGITTGVNGMLAGAYNTTGSATFSGVMANASGVTTGATFATAAGSGTQILTGANTYTGTTTIGVGSTLQIGNSGMAGTLGTGAVVSNGTLAVNRTDPLLTPFVLSNSISGTGRFLQQGTGTTKLTGTNTFSGGMTISVGTVLIGNGGSATPNYNTAAGTGLITMGDSNTGANNTAIYLEKGYGPSPLQTSLTRDINVTSNGTGTVTLGGLQTATSGAGWTAFAGKLALNHDIILNDLTNDRVSLDGFITGTGNITLTSIAQPGINASSQPRSIMAGNIQSDFVGNYIVTSNAVLQLNTTKGLSGTNNLIINGGGQVRINGGQTLAINGLSGSGTIGGINLGSGSPSILSVGNSNGSATFSGTITGAGPVLSLVKNGSGTQILTGTNTYTGTTAVNGGTLQVGNGGATGTISTAAVTLSNGGTLNYQLSTNLTMANAISGSGNVIANVGGTLTESTAINLTSGSINLNAIGNVAINANLTTAGAGGLSVQAGNSAASTSTLTFGTGVALTQNSGTGNISLTTTGTGDLWVPKIVDNGTGDVNLIAGSMLAVGNTAGNIKTTAGNTVSLSSGDKLLIYSGSETATGSLSTLNSGFSSLVTVGPAGTVNAKTSTAYGSTPNTISGGSNTQVMFRDTTTPTFTLSLNNLTKTYGDVDPTSGFTAVGNPTNLTFSSGNNTFTMLTSTALSGLVFPGTRQVGQSVGTYQYSGITESLSNVTLTGAMPSLVINPKALTITANTINATYDGVSSYQAFATAAGVTTSGLVNATVNGVVINDSITSVTSTMANSGVAQAGSVSRTISNAVGNGLSNYIITYANSGAGTGTVAKADLILNGNNLTSTYNGSTQVNTYTLVSGNGATLNSNHALGSDTLIITGMGQGKNVLPGAYVDNLQVAAGSNTTLNNYNITKTNGSITINPVVLSASLTGSVSKTYNGDTSASLGVSNFALAGMLSGESVSVANTTGVTGTYLSANVLPNNGVGTVTAFGLSTANLSAGANTLLSNYVLPAITTTSPLIANIGTITAKALTLVGLTVSDKVYDATTSATVGNAGSLSGVVGSDQVVVAGLGVSFANANVGSNKPILLTTTGLTGSSASNYTLNPVASTTASITQANLLITGVTGVERTYTGLTSVALDASNATITGLKGSDSFTLNAGVGNYLSADAGVGKALNISGQSLSPSGSSLLSNYNVNYQTTGTGTVLKAAITAVIDNKTTTYGTVGALTYTVNGLVNGETAATAGVTITGLSSAGYTSSSTTNNVGQYTITAQAVGSQNYTNYTLSSISPGTLTITPATLTFTANGNSKLVTQADPTLSYSTSGLVNGDTSSVYTGPNLSRAAGESAGSYAISMTGGSASSNYSIVNYVPATSNFKILGAQSLLITMNDSTTTYGTLGTPTIQKVQYLDSTGSSFKTLTNTSGSLWTDGVGGSIDIYGATIGVNVLSSVGAYAGAVTATTTGLGNSNGNFNSIVTQAATYNVTQAALTIAAKNVNRVYDGTNFTSADATVTGLMNSESVIGLGGLTYTGSAINSRNAGMFTIQANATTPSAFSNYNITYQSGTLTTTQAYLNLTGLTVNNKVYDGSTSATLASTGTLNGVFGSDNVNLVTPVATFTSSGAGLNKTVNLNGLSLTGNEAGNYTLINSLGASPSLVYSANITPKVLTASGVSAVDKVYDTTNSATLNTTNFVLSGVVSGDESYVTGVTSGLTGTFANANAGVNKTVTISGYGLSGLRAGNYEFVSGYTTTASATISKALASVTTADSSGHVYNGSTYSLSAPVVTGVYSNDASAVVVSQTNTSAVNAGSYTSATSLTGNVTTLNNYDFTIQEGTLTIGKANLLVSAVQGNSIVFNGLTQNQTSTVTGLASTDTNAIGVNGLVSARNAGNYMSNLSLSGDSTILNNYNVALTNSSFNIAKAEITSNTSSSVLTYNGQQQSLAAPVVSGIVSNTDVAVSQTGRSLTNVGSTTSSTSLTGSDANNYVLSSASTEGTLTIGKANVSIAVNSLSTTYDGLQHQTSGYTVTSGTIFGSDNLGVTGDALNARNAGSYQSIASASNNNYQVSITNGSLNIAKADFTLSAVTDTKTYDGSTTSSGVVLVSPLAAGDSISNLSQAFSSKNVLGANSSLLKVGAGYTLNDGNGGNNYNAPTLVNAAGTITPASLTISAVTDTKTYDGLEVSNVAPVQSGTVYSGDSLVLNGQAFASKHVMGLNGSTLNANSVTLNDGNNGHNYVVSYQSAQGTIQAAQLTVKAATDTKVYDGNQSSSAIPVLIQGSVATGDTFIVNGQSFASKNVNGAGNSILNANAVTISDGNDGNNYAVTYQSNSGTITPLATTVTINGGATTYNGTTQSVTGHTISNLVSGDTLNVVGDTISGRNAGTYNSTATANNSNYAITVNQGAFVIGQANLILNATSDSKVYDATNLSNQAVQVSGLQGTDTVSATQKFNSPNVLTATSTQVSAYNVLDGNNGANYKVVKNDASATITPAPVVISGVTAENKIFDGSTSAVLNTAGMTTTGVVAGEKINTSVTGQFETPAVGQSKQVNLSMTNTAGAGTILSNYSISKQTTTKADITAAVVPASSSSSASVAARAPTIVIAASSSGAEKSSSISGGSTSGGSSSAQASPFSLARVEPNTCSEVNIEFCECEEFTNGIDICELPKKRVFAGGE